MPSTGLPKPFFSVGDAKQSPLGRLLLVSYHFPPSRAVGALRWQKLAGYAASRGWALDVVTLDPECLENRDPDRLEELPPGIRVYGVPSRTPKIQRFERTLLALRRQLTSNRANRAARHSPKTSTDKSHEAAPRLDSVAQNQIRALPRTFRECLRIYTGWLDLETTSDWAHRSARLATALVRQFSHRAIITCGPPHMAHEGGRIVAAAAGIPLVMDMRDPWSLVQRVPEALASPLWLRAARRLERRAAEAASLVVVNTEPHREALSGLYPRLSAPIITVTNGYDEEAIPESLPASRFIIAYAGAIYLDRDPRPLVRAAGQLVRQLQLTPKQFGIAFMGNHSYGGVSLLEMARSEGLEAFLELRASGSRREALEFLGRASVLVSLPQDSDMAIPSKVYEYMQFRAWILALAEPGSATARLLEGTAADVVQPHDVERMLTVLRHRYEEHAAGIRRPRLADDPRYGRKRQSQILLDALDQVLPPNVSRYVPSPSAEALV